MNAAIGHGRLVAGLWDAYLSTCCVTQRMAFLCITCIDELHVLVCLSRSMEITLAIFLPVCSISGHLSRNNKKGVKLFSGIRAWGLLILRHGFLLSYTGWWNLSFHSLLECWDYRCVPPLPKGDFIKLVVATITNWKTAESIISSIEYCDGLVHIHLNWLMQ